MLSTHAVPQNEQPTIRNPVSARPTTRDLNCCYAILVSSSMNNTEEYASPWMLQLLSQRLHKHVPVHCYVELGPRGVAISENECEADARVELMVDWATKFERDN